MINKYCLFFVTAVYLMIFSYPFYTGGFMATKNLSVAIEDEIYEEINKKAKTQDLTISQVVRRAIKEYLDFKKKIPE